MNWLIGWLGCLLCLGQMPVQNGLSCRFKGAFFQLDWGMQTGKSAKNRRPGWTNAQLDTASNCYWIGRQHVDIIRQDHPLEPNTGLALSFELNTDSITFPYIPEYAAIQFKSFKWGGVPFEKTDTLNYSGVTNEYSEDIQVEILSFHNDTITGRFQGLLLNGAGGMAVIDSGYFCVRLYKKWTK